MTRQLTAEQAQFVAMLKTPEVRAEQERNQRAHDEATAAARIEAEKRWAERRAQQEAADRALEEQLRPLREALRAAGIKLAFDGYYEGAWMKYQIGDGPVVEIEEGLDAFDD